MDYKLSENNNRIFLHHQAIISTYRFKCCGNITEWGADVHRNDTAYTIDFQVWRPSPTVDNSTGSGCYSLVGNNKFVSLTLSGALAKATPSPEDYIQFNPGDVLGFYVGQANEGLRRESNGIVIRTYPNRLTSESVRYASIAPTIVSSQGQDCPYTAGRDGDLNSLTLAAPACNICQCR